MVVCNIRQIIRWNRPSAAKCSLGLSMATIIEIDRKTIENIRALTEITANSLLEIEKLNQQYANPVLDFALKEAKILRDKLALYEKISTCVSEHLLDSPSSQALPALEEMPPEAHVLDSSSQVTPNFSGGHASVSNIPFRNSVTFSLSEQMPDKNEKSYQLILIELYPERFTIVKSVPGRNLLQLLKKKLRKFNLKPEARQIMYMQRKIAVSWETDSSKLLMPSLVVLPPRAVELYKPFSQTHDLKQNRLIFTSYCCYCHKLMSGGFKCQGCNRIFHQKCLLAFPERIACKTDLEYKKAYQVFEKEPVKVVDRTLVSSRDTGSLTTDHYHRNPSDTELGMYHNTSANSFYTLNDLLQLVESIESAQSTIVIALVDQVKKRNSTTWPHRSSSIHHSGMGNNWEIGVNELRMSRMVGSGTYGTVYKARWHGDVAIKFLKVKKPNQEQLDAFKNEVVMLRFCRHKNIVMFMGCVYEPVLGIVTEWCDGDTLYQHIHVLDTDFEEKEICNLAQQIASGMESVHFFILVTFMKREFCTVI